MPKPRRVAIMLDLDWPHKRHAGIFTGTQHYAQENGWESIIDEYVDDTLSKHSAQAAPYDGIIARVSKKLSLVATRLSVPLVNVWFSSPVSKRVPGVFPDYAASGRLRAEHLLARGFRHFASLVASGDRAQELEMKTFLQTLDAAGYNCAIGSNPLISRSTFTLKEWRKSERTIDAWMDTWETPIGVNIGSDSYGRIVAQKCRNRHWRVPEDVAIIAGSNEEMICENPRPALTSVEMGFERIGYEAARLLERMMDGDAPPTEPILLPAQGIVARESTDFFAVDDQLIASALAFIASKVHLQIGADDVALAVKTGTRTLQRHFQKHLNRPIATEIRRIRIERAKRELTQSNRSLADISRAVGFGEAMRMCEVFRRELGVTPSQYRRQRQLLTLHREIQ